MKTKNITCIVCPNGCDITLEFDNHMIVSCKGALCKRGEEYVRQEMENPMRNVTSSIKVENGALPLVSVRLSNVIPKKEIMNVMQKIKSLKIEAPVCVNQIACENILNLGVDLIITKNIDRKNN